MEQLELTLADLDELLAETEPKDTVAPAEPDREGAEQSRTATAAGGATARRCRVASSNSVTGCLIENVTRHWSVTVLLGSVERRFSVPAVVRHAVAHSLGQPWPQATAGGGV